METLLSSIDILARWDVVLALVVGSVGGVIIGAIPGVGPEIAASIRTYFESVANRGLVEELKCAGLKMQLEGEKLASERTLSDKTFVVTGTLKKFTRKKIQEFIRQRGGKVTSSVTSKTDYLVVGDNPGSKLQKARDLGVTIIGEDELSQYEDPPE